MTTRLFRNLFMIQAPEDDGKGGGGGGGDDKDKSKKSQEDDKDKGKGGSQEDDDNAEGGEDEGNDVDFDKLPERTKKEILKLRKENKGLRTERNNSKTEAEKLKASLKKVLGDEAEEDPEKVAEARAAENDDLKVRNSMLELALEHGVAKDQRDYFEFLLSKEISGLKEGEELSDEAVQEIAEKAKAQGGGKGPANSSTKGDAQNGKNNSGKKGEVTEEQFAKMGITERTKLYRENRELYDRLMAASKK